MDAPDTSILGRFSGYLLIELWIDINIMINIIFGNASNGKRINFPAAVRQSDFAARLEFQPVCQFFRHYNTVSAKWDGCLGSAVAQTDKLWQIPCLFRNQKIGRHGFSCSIFNICRTISILHPPRNMRLVIENCFCTVR